MSEISGTPSRSKYNLKQFTTVSNASSALLDIGSVAGDVQTISVSDTNSPSHFTVETLSGGSGYTNGDYTGQATTTTGSGSGMTVDISVVGGTVVSCVINAQGSGYDPNEVITIDGPGGSNATFTIDDTDLDSARSQMHDIIHVTGSSNIFLASNPNLPASAPANILSGCRVFKLTDGTNEEFYRVFLYTHDNHGVTVGTGTTKAELYAGTRDVSMSAANNIFAEPLVVHSKPSGTKHRVVTGETGNAFSGVSIAGESALSGSGILRFPVDIVSTATTDLQVGDEIVMPEGVKGELTDFSIAEWGYYFALDEDTLIFYSDMQFTKLATKRPLISATDRTFQALGYEGGNVSGTDQFASGVTVNPNSMSLTGSYTEEQKVSRNVTAIEFYTTAADCFIQFGRKTTGVAFLSAEGDYTSAPTIFVAQDRPTVIPFDTGSYLGFRAKSGTSSDTLYWNYVR